MKNIILKSILAICIVLQISSCKNQDWEFDDFDYTSTYFPYQYPVRTLILGDVDGYDNENDKNHRFLISAAMGGVYANNKNISVEYEIADFLVNDLYFENDEPVLLLPESYYTLLEDKITIPAGKTSGGVTVQLKDEFFADPLAYSTNYVLPLIIKSAGTDSIIRGQSSKANPDRRVAEDWNTTPKDFTIFAIKYINKYHGKYLLRGKAVINDGINPGNEVIYRQEYVEQDIVTELSTRRLDVLRYSRPVPVSSGTSPGDYIARITIAEDNSCVVTSDSESPFQVSGSGKYAPDGDNWGGKARNAFYLNITLNENGKNIQISDTLVFRDNTVAFEEYAPVVK